MAHNLSLVILAGGLGSRYNGQKQLDPVGPAHETLMEYAIYDAFSVGIHHFVFIINQQFDNTTKKYFQSIIERKNGVVEFILQTTYTGVPLNLYDTISQRQKPWGTAHALLVAKSHLTNPFVVINADDYYGREAFYLANSLAEHELIVANRYAMVAYDLTKTLSENGTVSRGICTINQNQLVQIEERTSISRVGEQIMYAENDQQIQLDHQAKVSMNFWVLHPSIFRVLEDKFALFLKKYASQLKQEFFLPQVINELIQERQVDVLVKIANEHWFGMTYPEDKPIVQNALHHKTQQNDYPLPLWK